MFTELLHISTTRDQSLYLDPTNGLISFRDWSGATPETTDDGPLVVDPKSELHVKVSFFANRCWFSAPVSVPRTGEQGYITFDTPCMRELEKHMPRLKVNWAEGATLISEEVCYAWELIHRVE